MMNRIVFCIIIQQFWFLISSVESLRGTRVEKTAYGKYPFIASLQNFRGEHFCLGTLITNRHVITAGHCLDLADPRNVSVVFQEVDLEETVVRYAIASWIMYRDGANQLQLQETREETRSFDIAIATMMNRIIQRNGRPIPLAARLTGLNKQQVQGKATKIIGWRGNSRILKLAKAVVDTLRDDDCERNIRLVSNRNVKSYDHLICTAADPYVLLEIGDGGGPLLDRFGNLMGIHTFVGPRTAASWGNFSDEFLNSYKVNLHANIAYDNYRQFIANVTGYH